MRTATVRRMFLHLPTQLGDILPAAGTSSLVQLGYVARGLVVGGPALQTCKLSCAEDDVAEDGKMLRGMHAHPWR